MSYNQYFMSITFHCNTTVIKDNLFGRSASTSAQTSFCPRVKRGEKVVQVGDTWLVRGLWADSETQALPCSGRLIAMPDDLISQLRRTRFSVVVRAL